MFEDIPVRDWMTSPVYIVLPNTPITAAYKIMKDKNVRHLPVMGNSQVIGMITLGDIREARPSSATTLSIWELNYLWSQLLVDRIMSTRLITVMPEEPMLNAVELMLNNKVSGLPVVESGALVGIVTEADVFRMLVKLRRPTETVTSS